MLEKILKNRLIIFIIAVISLILSIAIFYFTTKYYGSETINDIAGFFLVVFCTCIIFLVPKKISENFLYYAFTFPLECERKYLTPSFIIYLILEILAFYLSIFVIPDIGPSDLMLSPNQLRIKVIIVGLAMMVLILTPLYGLCITAHRLFSKKDNYDYKSKFDFYENPNKKLDTFMKKDKK